MKQRKPRGRIWLRLTLDIVCTGAALVVFALFHHVLPRQQQSMGIVISNPYAAAEAAEAAEATAAPAVDTTAQPTVRVSASAAASDQGSSGRSARKNGKSGGSFVPTGKGGSALTEESASMDSDENATPLSQKFSDRFTEDVVISDSGYSSPDIAVTITQNTTSDGRVTYYLADIYVRDVTCFQSALAQDTYGSGYRDSISDMAYLNDALLAVNGDYYGNTNEGVVIRNGTVYRANPTDCDVCVLYYDGVMRVMPGASFDLEEAIADGAWQAWTFGPALLDGSGDTISAFASTSRLISANPRTAIGYYEPGHYCLVVVDGRGESAGITLPALSQLFHDLGCAAAYNLDGGNSSIMVWQDAVINDPSGGGRESSDALLIAEVRSYE